MSTTTKIESLKVDVPEGCNVIFGQSHFIKTVEDLYETIVESGTSIKFGIAFAEASGKRLVRSDGNDAELVEYAEKEMMRIGAGHTFIIFVRSGYPINILNRIKEVSEVCTIYVASANSLEIVYADVGEGRAVLGVVDGAKPLGIEGLTDKEERRELLRKIGYKK